MHISIIANGFQEDYMSNLLNNLYCKVDRIDFIVSSIHESRRINAKVNFYNLRKSHDEKASSLDKSIRILKYFYHLLNYINHTEAKIIHVQFIKFAIIEGIILTLYIRLTGKKVVYTAHDILPRSKNNFYNRLVYKIIYKLQNKILVHTEYLSSRIIKEFNIDSSKVSVITHGLYKRIADTKITIETSRAYFKLAPNTTVLLFFGIIAEYKGFDVLIESLNSMKDRSEFQVLVAGKVLPEYKLKFDALIQSCKTKNTVLILRYIRDEEVEYCFRASNVTVIPYKEASQSGVMLMSYAYGVPVIAPALGGFSEDIISGKTGYLFEPNNPKSLADVLIKFKSQWAFENTSSLDIKNFAISNYSWDKTCNEIANHYRHLLQT